MTNGEKRLVEQALDALRRASDHRGCETSMREYGRENLAQLDRKKAIEETAHAVKLLKLLLEE